MKRFDRPGNDAEQTMIYKRTKERDIRMEFRPPLTKVWEKAPVYVIIPGGGWCRAVAVDMLGFSAISVEALRKEGWAVASLEYRTAAENNVKMDTIVSDIMDAGRYLSKFRKELGIDPLRIVTSGHSAGGHLALMMALAPQEAYTVDSPFDPVKDRFGVVASAPLSAPTILYRDSVGYLPDRFGTEHLFPEGGYPLSAHKNSPYDYITPLSVPTLMAYGTHDNLVYAENSVRFYEKCRSVGAPCELCGSVYGGHCFEPMAEGKTSEPGFEGVQKIVTDFVRRFAPKG